MQKYKKPYLILFGAVADAVEYLEKGAAVAARETLITAMQQAEEEFIEYDKNLSKD